MLISTLKYAMRMLTIAREAGKAKIMAEGKCGFLLRRQSLRRGRSVRALAQVLLLHYVKVSPNGERRITKLAGASRMFVNKTLFGQPPVRLRIRQAIEALRTHCGEQSLEHSLLQVVDLEEAMLQTLQSGANHTMRGLKRASS